MPFNLILSQTKSSQKGLTEAYHCGSGLHAASCLLCYSFRSMPSCNIYKQFLPFRLSSQAVSIFVTLVYDFLTAELR